MTSTTTTTPAAFVILADGAVDQIVGSRTEATREARDLRALGCAVTVKPFATWLEAEAYETKKRGW
jgi:hypothetical protein